MAHAEYIRTTKTLFSKVGHEFVALNVERGQCYGLNDTASVVWEMLDTPQSVPAICNALEARFDVAPDECRSEVEQLLAQMVEEGLVSQSLVGVDND